MKRLIVVIALAVLVILPVAAQRAEFTAVNGKVEYRAAGGGWQTASVGATVDQNTTISTGFGASATLAMGESSVEVEQLTRMVVEEIVENQSETSTRLALNVGRINAEVRNTSGRTSDFRVHSPLSTAAVRGTSFSFDGETITVNEGTVAFINRLNQSRNVGAGQSSSTTGDDVPKKPSTVAQEDSTTSIAPIGSGSDDEGEGGGDDAEVPSGPRSTRGSAVVTVE